MAKIIIHKGWGITTKLKNKRVITLKRSDKLGFRFIFRRFTEKDEDESNFNSADCFLLKNKVVHTEINLSNEATYALYNNLKLMFEGKNEKVNLLNR